MSISPSRPPVLLAATIAVLLVVGCQSSSAIGITAGPSAAKCQPSLAASPVVSSGGTGVVKITTQPECAWNASTQVGWITGLSPAAGQGSAQIDFVAAANPLPSLREGEIVVNDNPVRVVQDAAPCAFELRPPNRSVSAAGGTAMVGIVAMDGCHWTAVSNAPWITVTSRAGGSGSGSVTLSIASNSGAARSGTVTIAGEAFAVVQDAAGSAGNGGGGKSKGGKGGGKGGGNLMVA